MKQSRPSNRSSEVESQPTASPDVDEAPVPGGGGGVLHVLVVSAYEAHHLELFAFLARATGDRSAAEDLLKETFVRLAREARTGYTPLELRPWLYRVATSLVLGGDRRPSTAARALRGGGSRGAGELGQEGVGDMELVIDGLSLEARLALLLSAAGFSGNEIATVMDRTEAAARTLLGRARARVRIRRDLFAGEAP